MTGHYQFCRHEEYYVEGEEVTIKCDCDLIEKVRADERKSGPRIEIVEDVGQPARCKVWFGERLVFHGVSLSASYVTPVGWKYPFSEKDGNDDA